MSGSERVVRVRSLRSRLQPSLLLKRGLHTFDFGQQQRDVRLHTRMDWGNMR